MAWDARSLISTQAPFVRRGAAPLPDRRVGLGPVGRAAQDHPAAAGLVYRRREVKSVLSISSVGSYSVRERFASESSSVRRVKLVTFLRRLLSSQLRGSVGLLAILAGNTQVRL